MRSNPLDNKREPDARPALAIGGAALLLFGVGGLVLQARTGDARIENVRAAVVAAGYGDPVVQPIKGDECWRAREGYSWKTATASGSACAGPRDDVQLFPGVARPHL